VTIAYSALLFDPVYAELGVPAVIGTGEITVIDDTRPKVLPISSAVTQASAAEVRSVGPGAFARIYELTDKGITRDVWLDATLTFNGRTWIVRSYELRGSPMGEDWGEVRFLLKEHTGNGNGGGGDGDGFASSSSVSSRSISGGAI
jgi:hypothetical protein